jgi:hypothetical protein
MNDSIERLSFELTTASIAEQERTLANLRGGAGTVLGAASIAGSFLGAHIAGRSLDVWASLATVAFVLCSGTAIWVLIPRDFAFAFNGGDLMAATDARDVAALAESYRAVCRWIEPRLELNRRTLDGLASWLTRACVLLAIEVVLWTMSITT